MEESGNMTREYEKTNWVCHQTPVNATNLNKIEDAIEELYNTSIDIFEILEYHISRK